MKSSDYEGNGMSSWTGWLMGAGVGAACMYLIDPTRGARRRGLIRDQFAHASNLTADRWGKTTRDVSHRVRGTWAATRGWVRPGEVSDDVLVERVRAKLGRYVSHPHAIDVYAQDGCVTLRGKILKHEVNELLRTVGKVPGVCEVDNQLEEHETAGNIPSLQGGTHRPGDQYEMMQTNWTPAMRTLVGSTGSALIAYGAARRDTAGAFLAFAGTGFVLRAATNLETKRLVGIGAGRRAVDIQKTIHINAPIGIVFAFWANFENFPHFMRNVREVRPTAVAGQSHWTVAGPGSAPIEFDAVITQFAPNQVIAWKTVKGAPVAHAGIVQFEPEGDAGTRLQIRFSYNPPGGAIGHAIAVMLGDDPKSKMDEDLARMKTLIETGNPPRDAAQPIGEAPER